MPASNPRLYVFHGPDTYSAQEASSRLRRELGVAGSNVVRLEGTASVGDIASACHTATFFAEPRLVIIEGLSSRFSGRRRARSRPARGARATDPASELDQLIDALSDLPETTTVVLLEQNPGVAFLDAFKDLGKVQNFPIKRPAELRTWAHARFKELGAGASDAAVDRLTENLDGYHLGEMAQEIDKLITYADGRRVEVADVDEVGSSAISHQTWDLTDAVVAGRADRALAVLQRMTEKEFPRQVLLYMIVRQYRQVLLAQALLREGLSTNQIGERLGIAHSYPLGKVIDQASRFPAGKLDLAYRRLLEADAAVKTGVMDIDTALDLLIADLAQLTNSNRRGQPDRTRRG
jgi:DNA polymerase-3 subunit delta